MTKRERELHSEGALAYVRGEDLAGSAYARLRNPEARAAFQAGYESQRRHAIADHVAHEDDAEDFDANLAQLKAFAKTL